MSMPRIGVRERRRLFHEIRDWYANQESMLAQSLTRTKAFLDQAEHHFVQGQQVEGDWAPPPLLPRSRAELDRETRYQLLEERGQRYRAALQENGFQHYLLDLEHHGALFWSPRLASLDYKALIVRCTTSPAASWVIREAFQAHLASEKLNYDAGDSATWVSLEDIHELVGASVSARSSAQIPMLTDLTVLGLLSTTITDDNHHRATIGAISLRFLEEVYYPHLAHERRQRWKLGFGNEEPAFVVVG